MEDLLYEAVYVSLIGHGILLMPSDNFAFPAKLHPPVSHITSRQQQILVNLLCPHFHHQNLVASFNNLPRICGANRPRANDNDLGKDSLAEE